MNALRAAVAVVVLALVGCGFFEGKLGELDAGPPGAPGTGGVPGTGGAVQGTGGAGSGTGGASQVADAGTGGAPGTFATPPACPTNLVKGSPCTDIDLPLCSKTCGPERVGFKTETCLGGVYVEDPCQFDPLSDYSCYAIPAMESPACPTALPQAGAACLIPDCTLCGVSNGYLDSTGAAKTGYCVCLASTANPIWSCATATAWPCPSGNGC